MKKLILGLAVSLFSIAVQSTEINSGQGTTNNETLNGYRSFELGEAIFLLMPDKNMEYVGWDFRSDAPVLWMTEGYKTEKDDTEISFRDGLIRVNVQGTESYILRKKKEELAWTIRYSTFNNPKFGVDSISLKPGGSDEECFGELYENCDFKIKIEKSLKSVNVNVKKVCEENSLGYYGRGYELSHRDKKSVFAKLMQNTGSGGTNTSFEIFLHKKAKNLCKDDEEDSATKDSKVVVEKPKKSVKTASKQTDLNICENFSGIARTIMAVRQGGTSVSEAMKIAVGNKIIESLVINTYSRPSFSSPIYQEKAIREYQDEAYLSCIKTFRQ